MRWKQVKFEEGDTRLVECFLFLPKTIDREIRWLEFATIEQVYVSRNLFDDDHIDVDFYWKDLSWRDK